MAKIRFENGTTVNFDGDPTPLDIEEVAKSISPTPMKSLLNMGKSVLNRFMPDAQSEGHGPLEAIGQLMPSEKVSPMDIISGVAPYKASKLIRKGMEDVFLPKPIRGGIGRMAYDIATDPESYVAPGAIAKTVPGVAIKGGKILRSGMGISSDSARWIKTRGAKAIFTPEKEAVDFIKTTLSPIVQRDVELATSGVIKKAEKMFSVAEGRLKTNNITLDKTFNNAKEILNNYGMLDASGRILPSIKNKEIPRALKVMAELYSDALPASKKIAGVGPTVNKGFFKFYRQMLRDVQGSAGAFKRDVQHVIEGLYDDMEKAGATGIKQAKELYRKASQFEEQFGLTPAQIETKLSQALDPKNTESIKRLIKPILGKKTEDIFKAIKDHRVAQEFVSKGRLPWSLKVMPAIFGRPGRRVLKEIYESRYPLPLLKKP